MNAAQLMPVPFYEDTVVLVGQNDEPYVAMKPVVLNMGLSWQGQHEKLLERFDSVIRVILTTGADGKQYEMICLPLRKLPAWLYSLSPSRVKPELRDKIIRYQEECDDALWDYWTKGSAVRPGAPNTAQRISLSRLRLDLLKELHRCQDNAMRSAIHEQLADVSRAMGLSVPELDSIGQAEPEMPDIVRGFWEALAFLDGKGVEYNHAVASNLVAVNMPELAALLLEHGHPLRMDRTLRDALWMSPAPRCLHKNHAVHSALAGKTLKCWVFERPATHTA